MEKERILEKIKEADMVLVGVGEEFAAADYLRKDGTYVKGKELLQEAGCRWLIPMWMEYYSQAEEHKMSAALEKLGELLQGKNYFLVSSATHSRVVQGPWKEGRAVMPCGNNRMKQCAKGCPGELAAVTQKERAALWEAFGQLAEGNFPAAAAAGAWF